MTLSSSRTPCFSSDLRTVSQALLWQQLVPAFLVAGDALFAAALLKHLVSREAASAIDGVVSKANAVSGRGILSSFMLIFRSRMYSGKLSMSVAKCEPFNRRPDCLDARYDVAHSQSLLHRAVSEVSCLSHEI